MTFADDGTPWTALVHLTGTGPDSQGYWQSTGYVARIVAAQPASDVPEAFTTALLPGIGAVLGLGIAFGRTRRRITGHGELFARPGG